MVYSTSPKFLTKIINGNHFELIFDPLAFPYVVKVIDPFVLNLRLVDETVFPDSTPHGETVISSSTEIPVFGRVIVAVA